MNDFFIDLEKLINNFMARKFVFLISILNCFSILAQSEYKIIYEVEKQDTINTANKVLNDKISTLELDLTKQSTLLKYILNNEFSRLVTGNSLTGLGNYVSVSTADNTLSASFNVVKPKGVWDVSISGGSNDGITNFVSNTKINSGLGIGLSYHFRLNSDISINDDDIEKIVDEEFKIKQKFKEDILKFQNYQTNLTNQAKYNNDLFVQDTILKDTEIKFLKSELSYYSKPINFQKAMMELRKLRDFANNKNPFKKQIFEKDSIELTGKVQKIKKNLRIKKSQLLALKETHSYKTKNYNRLLAQKYNDEEAEIEKNREKLNKIKATDVSFTWLTLGAEASYNEYSLFDKTREFEKQVYSKNDLISSFTLAISKYSNKSTSGKLPSKNVKFYSIGVKSMLGNNISTLGLYEVRTLDSIAPNRNTLKKQDAYIGEFKNKQLSFNIFGDYYKFFGNKNNVGLHLRGTVDLGNFKPVTSFRVGAIIPFSKIDELKSNVNIELFVGLNDLFKNAEDESIFSRNVFGLQATLPLNFKIL